MPGLHTRQFLRGLRAVMLVGLCVEILYTIKYPWHSEQQEDAYFLPAWRLNAIISNASERNESECISGYHRVTSSLGCSQSAGRRHNTALCSPIRTSNSCTQQTNLDAWKCISVSNRQPREDLS